MALQSDQERLESELSLLNSMYPSDVSFNEKSKEVTFVPQDAAISPAKLCIRLSDEYPSNSRPDVLIGSVGPHDVRDEMRTIISSLPVGVETIDAVFEAFLDVAIRIREEGQVTRATPLETNSDEKDSITVIVWLHHLLSTTKRKAIQAPTGSSVAGLVKPGYPGVLLFTGPSTQVQEHVRDLRGMNWQAFQVRAELEELWQLKHGYGVKEVETMAEIVENLGNDESRKAIFLESMKIK